MNYSLNSRILSEQEKNKILNEFEKNLKKISEIISQKNSAGFTTDQKRVISEQDPPANQQTASDNQSMMSAADAKELLGYDSETGEVDIRPEDKIEGFYAAYMPDGKVTHFPKGSKPQLFDDDDPLKIDLFKEWNTEKYSPYTKEWVPDTLSKIAKIGSISSFVTPDGKKYTSNFQNDKLKEFKTWEAFNSWTNINTAPKNEWKFVGYTDEQGNGYSSPKPPADNRAWYEKTWDWLVKNWQLVAEVVIGVLAAILSGGMSLMVQAAIQLAIGVAFSIDDIVDGDYLGAIISIVVGAIPFGFIGAKFGVKNVNKFLKTYGPKLKNVKTADEFLPIWKEMSDPDKLLLTKAFQQTPGELKQATNKMLYQTIKTAEKEGSIVLKKIPIAQRTQWKDAFVVGGTQLAAGYGLSKGAVAYEEGKEKEKAKEAMRNMDFETGAKKLASMTQAQSDSTLNADLEKLHASTEDEDY
jgi:hypothetical protein